MTIEEIILNNNKLREDIHLKSIVYKNILKKKKLKNDKEAKKV
jgi:hypothetical protein